MAVDSYTSYTELAKHENDGRDYRIHFSKRRSDTAVIAIHGGKIERGTLPIAKAIAGEDHTYYCFEGIKPDLNANRVLHVSSRLFDEPFGLSAVAEAHQVVSIHGAKGPEKAVYSGGLDLELRARVMPKLADIGIIAGDDPSPTRQGKNPANICNRGLTGKGLQLEFTYGLREIMFDQPDVSGFRAPNKLFRQIVAIIRDGLTPP